MNKVSSTPSAVKSDPSQTAGHSGEVDVRVALIQALIPLGLDAVNDLLQEEVNHLAGDWYSRKNPDQSIRRWGHQQGSVYLSDQKMPIDVPRVRDVSTDQEVVLEAYKQLQKPRNLDDGLLLRVLKGISNRNYEACAEAVPDAFGLSPSTVSRRYIKATAAKLKQFQERSLEAYDLVAIFIDGKTFADQEMLIALGVTIEGTKIPLGFVQTATENTRVCSQFLNQLIQRGLQYHQGVLVLVDGAKGLSAAVKKTLPDFAIIQRCQWHKREDVVAYLPKEHHDRIRGKLQKAYNQKTYKKAKADLMALKPQLELMNQSAKNSLEEGFEETLTLHRLGMAKYFEQSFRTTNCIESLNSQIALRVRNVKKWTNSQQRYRWLATALLDIEPCLRRIKGDRFLHLLRQAIQNELNIDQARLSA